MEEKETTILGPRSREIRLQRLQADGPATQDWADALNARHFPIGSKISVELIRRLTHGYATIEADVNLDPDETPIFLPALVPNRPTAEGRAFGRAFALQCSMQVDHLREAGLPIPERCKSCAFTRDTAPNGCSPTVVDAINCVTNGIPFYCHHGVKGDAEPSKLCGGWLAMRKALELEALKTKLAYFLTTRNAVDDLLLLLGGDAAPQKDAEFIFQVTKFSAWTRIDVKHYSDEALALTRCYFDGNEHIGYRVTDLGESATGIALRCGMLVYDAAIRIRQRIKPGTTQIVNTQIIGSRSVKTDEELARATVQMLEQVLRTKDFYA